MIWRIKSICGSYGRASEAPVTLVPEPSKLGTSLAATGSVTAENTSGMLLVEAATDCADGVAIATITSGSSATNCLAICPAVAVLPCALWKLTVRFSPSLNPASFNSSITPLRTSSSAGCSTIAVIATVFISVAVSPVAVVSVVLVSWAD